MSEKIVVPTLGESVTEATVAKWLKKEGDKVSSPSNGVLESISAKEGETVNVGALLGSITQSKLSSTTSESNLGEKNYSPPKIENDNDKVEKTLKHTKKAKIEKKKQAEPLVLNQESNQKIFNEEPFILEEEPLVLEEIHNEKNRG